MLDTRWSRSFNHPKEESLIGFEQLKWFNETMNAFGKDASVKHIMVASSVPVAFFSKFQSVFVYVIEKERYPSFPDYINQTTQILDIMAKHRQKVIAVGGDIHQYVDGKTCNSRNECFRTVVTSGLTLKSAVLSEWKVFLFYLLSWRYWGVQIANEGWQITQDFIDFGRNYAKFTMDQNGYSIVPVLGTQLGLTDHHPKQYWFHQIFKIWPAAEAIFILSTVIYVILSLIACFDETDLGKGIEHDDVRERLKKKARE
eukprot:TRINITY_DN8697_c0_g1_i2.p1 TRINITY_DN8697_c0_g1~~TRINITY_DN8697_c0_g1_i2.p1  ORF type:complete len:257 (+),score=89.60 TRINITY_DN8697_c0_g1_i2:332-1102(+)